MWVLMVRAGEKFQRYSIWVPNTLGCSKEWSQASLPKRRVWPASQLLGKKLGGLTLQVKTRLSYWWEYLQRLLASWGTPSFPWFMLFLHPALSEAQKLTMKPLKGASAAYAQESLTLSQTQGQNQSSIINQALNTEQREGSLFQKPTCLSHTCNQHHYTGKATITLVWGQRAKGVISWKTTWSLSRNGGARRHHLDQR